VLVSRCEAKSCLSTHTSALIYRTPNSFFQFSLYSHSLIRTAEIAEENPAITSAAQRNFIWQRITMLAPMLATITHPVCALLMCYHTVADNTGRRPDTTTHGRTNGMEPKPHPVAYPAGNLVVAHPPSFLPRCAPSSAFLPFKYYISTVP